MDEEITIRDVPKKVRAELVRRAALHGLSLEEYLSGLLERLASKPPVGSWVEGVRERKAAFGTRVTAAEILEARERDRR